MDPQQQAVAREFDTYRNSYEDTVNQAIGFTPFKVDFFVRAKAEHLKRLVAAEFGANAELSVLDIGCGVGQYHRLIADRFAHISGIDVSSEAIDRARGINPGVDYYSYDGSRLPFEDHLFDCAYAICVLHHVPVSQWEGFVAEMHRILRPGGLAVLFEHNPRNPLTMKAVNDCPFDRDAVLVKPARARQLFEGAGFRRVSVEHILTIPAIGGIAKAVDQLAGKLRCGTQYCVAATV